MFICGKPITNNKVYSRVHQYIRWANEPKPQAPKSQNKIHHLVKQLQVTIGLCVKTSVMQRMKLTLLSPYGTVTFVTQTVRAWDPNPKLSFVFEQTCKPTLYVCELSAQEHSVPFSAVNRIALNSMTAVPLNKFQNLRDKKEERSKQLKTNRHETKAMKREKDCKEWYQVATLKLACAGRWSVH